MGARPPETRPHIPPNTGGKLRPIFKFGVSFPLKLFYGSASASASANASACAKASTTASANASASASMRSLA